MSVISRRNTILKNKKLKLFLLFLALSSLFWFLSKLAKEYSSTKILKLNFVSAPKDKIIYDANTKEIELVIKGSGFDLFGLSFVRKAKIDLSKLKQKNRNEASITSQDFKASLQEQLGSTIEIVNVSPNVLVFKIGTLNSKKIPVKPNVKISYQSGYYLTEEIKITPKTILVTGEQKVLDTINVITTSELVLKDVNSNFEKKMPIIKVKNSSVSYDASKVKIIGKVEKITEGHIELPITIINNKGVHVKTFTEKITAKYKVSLKNYDKVIASDFKIVCDYSETKKDSLDYLIPKLKKQSIYVTDIVLSPNKIEYLILK